MKQRSRTHNLLAALLAALVTSITPVGAADLTWDHNADGTASDGAGTWLNANQWWDGAASATWNNATPDNAIIGSGGAGGTITLGAVTAGTVLINNFTGTYTLSGGSLESGGVTIGATAGNVTISTPVGGDGALAKNGGGTLTLSSTANTFSGGITINAGTLVASNDGNLGDVGGGLTFNGTCTFGNDGDWIMGAGRTITISDGANVTFNSGFLRINGPVVGSGTLTVGKPSQGNPGLYLVSTANTFTGAMNLNDKGASGNSNYWFNSLGDGPGAGIIRLGYGGQGAVFRLTTVAIAPLVLNHRQFDIGGSPGSFIVNDNIADSNANTININTDLLFTGAGSRTLGLAGNNTGDNTIAGKIPDGPTGTVISLSKSGIGTWVLAGANTYTGATTIISGTLRIGGAGQLGSGTYSANITNNGSFICASSAASQTLGGIINGTGSLTQSGPGNLTLSGTNTYTGTTTIDGGKLFVNGDQTSATGAVTVNADATLGGTGTLGGNTTVDDGGKLEFNLGTAPASHDKLEVAADKTFAFAGASVLTITSSGGATTGLYTLVTAPDGISGLAPATVNLPVGWTADAPQIVDTDLVINITSTGAGGNPYDTWSGGAAFDADANGDGVSNGLAFLLGAADPDANALGLLPTVDEDGSGGLVLSFSMLDAASRGTAALTVQWSNDLGLADLWSANEAAVPEPPGGTVNGVVFVVTENGTDPTRNDVVATIPSTEAAAGKLFGRLKGAEN